MEFLNHLKEYAPLAPIGTLLVALFAFGVAYSQLRLARKNIRLNALKNEFDIFLKLDEKQKIWVDGICQLNFLYKENQTPQIRQEIEKQTSQMELAKEQYLNTLDTICLHVLNGDISKDIFHKHCKKILEVISESCEQDLKSYTNITKLLATLT